MVDEQEPAKRIVKRVVKKTVARPATPSTPQQASTPEPTIRYGRPVATAARSSAPRSPVDDRPTPQAKAQPSRPSAPGAKAPARPVKQRRPAPTVDLRAKAATTRRVAGKAWWAAADRVVDGGRATGRFTAGRARAIAAYRLPHLNPYAASVLTGLVVGLLAVGLAAASLALFQSVRGVSSGGGLWGGIAFTAVAVVAMFAGEALLRGFGTPSPRLTSFLALVLTVVAMLGLFLDVVDGTVGLVLVPVLSVAGYALAHWLVELAENAPAALD